MSTLSILWALSLAAVCAHADPNQSGQLGSIDIKGQSRMQIRRDKPDALPEADPKASIEEFLAQNAAVATPADRLLARLPILLPPRTESDLVMSPWRTHLWSPPVLYLAVKNAGNSKIRSWRLVVTDDQGKPFRTLSGSGRLPEHIEWDGLSDLGEPLKVSHSYSCSLSLLDIFGVPMYLSSKTVRLGSYVDQKSNHITVLLDTSKLFSPGPALTKEGKSRLDETRDWLRSHYRSVHVEVFDEDVDMAQRQADLIRKSLEEGLHLKEGAIAAHGRALGKEHYARTQITAK